MAITYRTLTAGGDTAGTSDRTVTATPAVGDLWVVIVGLATNTNTAPTMTDTGGGTYYLVGTAAWSASANNSAMFVREQLFTNTTAVTITCASGSNAAGHIAVVMCAGSLRAGASAVRSFGKQENGLNFTTPTPVLNQNALTGNMTIWTTTSADASTSPPTNWTERLDLGQSSPTTIVEVATRDSGFTGSSVASALGENAVYAAMVVELDSSAAPITSTAGAGSASVQTGAGSGTVKIASTAGAGSASVQTGSGSAAVKVTSTAGAGTVSAQTGSGSAAARIAATGAGSAHVQTGAGSGTVLVTSTSGAGSVSAQTGAGAGAAAITGAGAGSAAKQIGAGTGAAAVVAVGSGSASASAQLGAGSGAVIVAGIGSGSASAQTGLGSGLVIPVTTIISIGAPRSSIDPVAITSSMSSLEVTSTIVPVSSVESSLSASDPESSLIAVMVSP